jgi:hypothetical protein
MLVPKKGLFLDGLFQRRLIFQSYKETMHLTCTSLRTITSVRRYSSLLFVLTAFLVPATTIAAEHSQPQITPWVHPLVKKGRLGSPLVEVTPFVFKGRLYRLENWQKQWEFPGSPEGSHFEEDEVRIRDMEADRVVSIALKGHGLGEAFVWKNRVYVFAGKWGTTKKWNITQIQMTSSDNLSEWTKPALVLTAEPQEKFFNVAVCRGKNKFVLLVESNDPAWPPFTFKYFVSDDLLHWQPIPDGIYGREKYVGGPALYYEGGFYYTLYLQNLGKSWETRITRSKDLRHWDDAPEERPFVPFDPSHRNLPLRPAEVAECNASDAELCYWKGKTIVYFTGSDQVIAGDLQWAEFAGTPRQLFEHFYEEPQVGASSITANNDATHSLSKTETNPRGQFPKEITGKLIASVDAKAPWSEGHTLELDIVPENSVSQVLIQESLRLGNRISSYQIEAFHDRKWQVVARGTSIGHQRIETFAPVKTSKIRLRVTKTVPRPKIKLMAIFKIAETE